MITAQRLEEVVKYLKYSGFGNTQKEIAEVLTIPAPNLSSALKGSEKYLTDGLVDKITTNINSIDRHWLLTGEGSMFRDAPPPSMRLDTPGLPAPQISYKVGQPYYDVDFSGGFGELIEPAHANPEYLINFPPYNQEGVFWCNISGRSMEPVLSSGDFVAMREIRNWQSFLSFGDIYAIITRNEMRTIKTIRKSRAKDKYLLVPANPDFDAQEIPIKEILRVYKILGCIKNL